MIRNVRAVRSGWEREGLKRRAAVFRQYKSVKPDPRDEGHAQNKRIDGGMVGL